MASSELEVLIDADRIRRRVEELGEEISRDYRGGELHLVGVLRGALQFMRDLSAAIGIPKTVDYISVASYGNCSRSSGHVQLRMELSESVAGKDILIVDDIVDTGITLSWMVEHVRFRGARSVKTCCLLDKPARRTTAVPLDYVGFPINDLFVVGYGLDYQEKFRDLPFISFVSPPERLV
ncbi:MAG: hypoxanthine phosphoribosyltransferase [Acidobacteriota bacterium]